MLYYLRYKTQNLLLLICLAVLMITENNISKNPSLEAKLDDGPVFRQCYSQRDDEDSTLHSCRSSRTDHFENTARLIGLSDVKQEELRRQNETMHESIKSQKPISKESMEIKCQIREVITVTMVLVVGPSVIGS